MNPRKLLRSCLATLDKANSKPSYGVNPQESEVWLTRDGNHQVLIVLRDPVRAPHQYPLTGIVIFPENGGDFKHKQQVLYPRFTLDGRFTNQPENYHPLDLRELIS